MASKRATLRAWWRQSWPNTNWRQLLRLELPVVVLLAVALPMQSYYRQSDAYNYLSEMWLPWTCFLLAAGAVAWLYHILLARPAARIGAALVALYVLMMEFDVRSSASVGVLGIMFPNSQRLLAFLVLLAAAWGVGRMTQVLAQRWPAWQDRQAVTLLRLVVIGIFLSNSFFLMEYLARHRVVMRYVPANRVANAETKLTPTAQRDVYYLLFDRYASQTTLQEHYDFDNSPFLNFLKDKGFTIRDNAYSNYQFTAPSVASTLRMDYHTDIQANLGSSTAESYLPYRRLLEDSPVSQLFANAGYKVTRLSSWYGVTREDHHGETVDPQFTLTVFGHPFLLSDLQSAMLDRTFFAPLFRAGIKLGPLELVQYNTQDTGQLVLDQLSALREAATTPHSQPNFIFAHVLSPHPQYVFLPDGSKPTYGADDDDTGAPRQLKYTNQLQFLNTQIERTVSTILASSKVPPVMIIQADEGPYPPEFASFSREENGSFQWNQQSAGTLRFKFGILAAYYLPDVPEDQKSQLNSSVNAFRFVFDHYFDGNFPYLPDCSFLFDGPKPFAFYDVTAKLRGTADPACPAYASLGSLH
ncbi:MAG TPA: sulfatase-like hydrolase/transferase [Candidatus Saccharimonadia bacterium]